MERSYRPRTATALLALAALMLLLAGPGAGPGHASPSDRRGSTEGSAGASIVGGTPASIASYPWLADVRYRGDLEEFSCGGTVVSPRLILTAAHCALTGTGRVGAASNFSVFTSVNKRREATPERISQVSQVLVFPEYEPSRVLNDAALLVLASPVSAPPLALATPSDEALLAQGTPIEVAGWGLISAEPPRVPNSLRDARSVVQSTANCQRRLRGVLPPIVPSSQICVKSQEGPRASLCDGDSGGPGIAHRADGTPVQIGIVSLKGSPDCSPAVPQVLARVDRVLPWVEAWKAVVELGAAAPAVVIPQVELPPVTRQAAEVIAWLGLEADLGNRFSKGRFHEILCTRIDREKVKCRVEWLKGNQYYRGGISVYSVLPREGLPYNFRYKIRRFNLRCWLTYLHPIQACNPRLFSR